MNRRNFLPLALILGLLAPLLVGFGPSSQQGSAIRLTLDAGYDGRFRSGMWMPLLLTVANDGPGVSGALRVRSENNAGLDATTYSTPISLPSQSRKQVFLYVALQSFARQVQVELVNETGEVLQTIGSPLTPAEPGDILTAVVTDSPSGSVDLTGIALGASNSFQANWAVENIPPQADALLGLDVMFFSDIDTGRLSIEQQHALADWVLAGGHLIVSGGSNYRLTTAALVDLLPVEIGGTTTTDDLTPLAIYAGRYQDSLPEPGTILATGTLRPEAKLLVAVDGNPLLARRHYGEGLVDYLAVDPGVAVFRRWPGMRNLWQTMVVTPHQIPGWSNGFQDWSAAGRVIQQAPGFDLPSALEMFGMLALYILIIGPLNYAVLRLIGRRELAWFTIPGLVIVFSIAAYLTGFSLRGTRVTMNRLSIVQVWPDSDRAQVDGLVGVLSPRRSTYQLAAPEGLTLRPASGESGGSPIGLSSVQQSTRIDEGNVYAAHDVMIDASLIAGFGTTGFIDNAPHINGSASLMFESDGRASLSGRIVNTTDFVLEQTVVLAPSGFQQLGTLEPGQAIAFDLPLTGVQSAQLTMTSGQDTGLFAQTVDITTRDILGVLYNSLPYYGASSREERLRRQRQSLLDALITDQDFSGGRGGRAFVVGWAHTSPLDMTLEGATWLPEDLTLYIFELPATVETPPDTPVIITPQFSAWAAADQTTALDARPYDLVLNGTDQVSFRYMPYPAAQLRVVDRLEVTARRTNAALASIYIWNWMTEVWDKLDMNAEIRATINEPADYVGPENAVEVLVVPDDPNDFVDFAQIDVTWYGTF